MIQPNETFGGSFPFAPHFSDSPGFRMHYVDEGPREGEVVLCLHGEPTWGYLFRHLITALSRLRRHFWQNLLGPPSHQKEPKIGDE